MVFYDGTMTLLTILFEALIFSEFTHQKQILFKKTQLEVNSPVNI
jgi:hypothetical protein